jgi:fructan beta-fructosidase
VLKTPNLKDFRDPKVIWHASAQKWIMSLAVADHVELYSSPNLKNWNKESEIGKNLFAHGGVWECPDLLSFNHFGKTIWVLLVSMNPGGPNGGSATQYIVGDFDGHTFKPYSTDIKWMDYGPDNYAGVTFSNVGDRKILIGWMSNWNYANVVPTEKWRSAMTVPRELKLVKLNTNEFILVSSPVIELKNVFTEITSKDNIIPNRLDIKDMKVTDFEITFSNTYNEKLIVGYHDDKKQFYIDRTKAGVSNFNEGFDAIAIAPRLSNATNMDLSILLDKTSIELFADGGRTVMTALFFPTFPYTKWEITSKEKMPSSSINLYSFK